MTTAFTKIYSFINTLNDDEVIRATDQNLSKSELEKEKNIGFENDKGAIHLYVRSGFFSKLRQILTSGTDGAIQKQHIAKELIIKTLENLPEHLKNEKSVERSIENIRNILKNNKLKDFTAGMIRKDLEAINDAFEFQQRIENPLYENPKLNPLFKGKSRENPAKNNVIDTVVATTPTVEKKGAAEEAKESFVLKLQNEEISGGNVTEPVFNQLFDYFGFKTDDDFAKKALMALAKDVLEKGSEEILIGDNALSEADSGSESNEENVAVSSSESKLPAIKNSLDPVDFGNPADETNSTLAKSAFTNNGVPIQNDVTIKQDTVVTEIGTENTLNSASYVSSSTKDTKAATKINPYLASLNTAWDPADDGYYTITKPFFITGTVTTTSLLAQAYLIPADKELEFTEEKRVLNKGNEGRVVQGNHILHKHLETNKQRPTRPFLKLAAKSPTKRIHIDTLRGEGLNEFKEELKQIYSSSISDIISEHKRLNNGAELESLVIVPIFQDAAKVSDTEINILVEELRRAQKANPNLKIHISANSDNHKKRIQSAYEKSFIETM